MSLNIFKWAEEIEKVYENLIESAKRENLEELEKLRTEQENLLERKIEDYRNAANLALKTLTQNLGNEDKIILEKLNDLTEKMKKKYEVNKENLIVLLIKNLRFDF